MKVKQTFVGRDLIVRHAGEVLPANAYAPEILQRLVSSGLVEQDKAPEAKPVEKPAAEPASKPVGEPASKPEVKKAPAKKRR